jgi:hypothetical protein
VIHQGLKRRHEEWSDSDTWGSLRSMSTLLLSIGCLSWWAACWILGLIWLAIRGHERTAVDDSRASGDDL